MVRTVHIISGDVIPLENVRTRCGRVIDRPMIDGSKFTAHNGNVFECTTFANLASCTKCINMGVFHGRPKARASHATK